mgnify:CR=1 FL=1
MTIVIDNPTAPHVQAALLKHHLRILQAGMKMRYPQRSILAACRTISGNEYPNSPKGVASALKDMTDFVNTWKELSQ